MKNIAIVINKDGKVKLELHGIKGTVCTDISEKIARYLGKIESKKYSKEYFEQEQNVDNYAKVR